MDMNMSLNMTQEQKLILTQQMKLSIDVLQYSALELKEFVDEKMQENPLLEGENTEDSEMIEFLKKMKSTIKNEKNSVNYNDDYISPLAFVTKEESVFDFLMEQLREIELGEKKRAVVEYLIENLDSRGYLVVEDLFITEEFQIGEEELEACISVLQGLEPAGIGARDVRECLLIQLRRNGKEDEIVYSMVRDHLGLVGDNKFKDIAKIYGITPSQAQKFGDEIRGLEPKPTRGYSTGEKIVYVTPDVYVKNINGKFTVELNSWGTPKLQVNDVYLKIVSNTSSLDSEKKYVKDKLGDAVALIKSIEQRKDTMSQVVEAIIKRQEEYFLKGVTYLKPMVMKEIAEDIGVHESTVSRAIRNKYLESSKGVVLIKDLFTWKLDSSSTSKEASAGSVKEVIKRIIDNEDKKKPLSDNVISNILGEEGIKISRRTVAKYREELGILSTSKRKRF